MIHNFQLFFTIKFLTSLIALLKRLAAKTPVKKTNLIFKHNLKTLKSNVMSPTDKKCQIQNDYVSLNITTITHIEVNNLSSILSTYKIFVKKIVTKYD